MVRFLYNYFNLHFYHFVGQYVMSPKIFPSDESSLSDLVFFLF